MTYRIAHIDPSKLTVVEFQHLKHLEGRIALKVPLLSRVHLTVGLILNSSANVEHVLIGSVDASFQG